MATENVPFRNVLVGAVVGSLLAATWFHLSVPLLSSDLPALLDSSLSRGLLKNASLILFEAAFVFVTMGIGGVPLYLLARRFNKANLLVATLTGAILGVLLSWLYGGPDFHSMRGAILTIVNFGVSGAIAGSSFWYCARPSTSANHFEGDIER